MIEFVFWDFEFIDPLVIIALPRWEVCAVLMKGIADGGDAFGAHPFFVGVVCTCASAPVHKPLTLLYPPCAGAGGGRDITRYVSISG
jgi:hypothetical protein